jgi:diheme cytochrome c
MSQANHENSFHWQNLGGTGAARLGLCLLISIPLTSLFAACQKPKPLPEQGTYAQLLYAERCGGCHRAYSPTSMTAAMWEVQVEAMRLKIAQAGQPPLSQEQHLTILDYLKRNAGKQ